MEYLIKFKTIDDPFMKLASSIVLYAVVDYRQAVRYLKKYPQNDGTSIDKKYREHLKECERFFKSDWFTLLCIEDIDGEKLADLIRHQEGWDGKYEL